jgi:hypothetical protein
VIPHNLKELVKTKNIIYTVVANMARDTTETYGDLDKLEYSSIVNRLFGDKESIGNLFFSLEGQIMPRTWSQGIVKGIVCKPTNNVIVGLFYHEEDDDPVAKFRFSKDINEAIEEFWKMLIR